MPDEIDYEFRNQRLLESFTEYCQRFPKQRFWQALRNWSGMYAIYKEDGWGNRWDTFYDEGNECVPDDEDN